MKIIIKNKKKGEQWAVKVKCPHRASKCFTDHSPDNEYPLPKRLKRNKTKKIK